MRTLVRSVSGLGIVLGLVVGAGAFAACGASAGDSGIPIERDLGPFIIPDDTQGTGDMAMQQQQPPVDMAMQQQPPGDMAMSTSGCGTVDTNGICMGDTLEYCSSTNKLKTQDCSSSGKSCKVSNSGYASCE
jgi:hypothetical protein